MSAEKGNQTVDWLSKQTLRWWLIDQDQIVILINMH